jgi:integrase
MSESKVRVKPEKPTPDFPLFPHPNGQWAKKIRGVPRYFGPWADPEAALQNYERQKDELHTPSAGGEKPAAKRKNTQASEAVQSNGTGKKDKSTRKKPHVPKDCPLWLHPTGQWAKQIRGRTYYFGVWEDREAAVAKYFREKDDLEAGRVPRDREESVGFTVDEMVNRWLEFQEKKIGKGLALRTFNDYKRVGEYVLDAFGANRQVLDIAIPEFAALRDEIDSHSDSPRIVRKEITWVKGIFKWAYDQGWIDRTIRFGASMKPPTEKEIRRYRGQLPKRMFEPEELRAVLKEANARMRAMTYLGINAAFWNVDCARLTLPVLGSFKDDWLDYTREKNGAKRACPLWPETIKAMKTYLADRPRPASDEHKDLVFLTFAGRSWLKGKNTPITQEFAKLLKKAGVDRPGLNFGALRHTFQTVAENVTRDKVPVAFIMGHVQADISTNYREELWDTRIRACTEAVHAWLNQKGEKQPSRRTF